VQTHNQRLPKSILEWVNGWTHRHTQGALSRNFFPTRLYDTNCASDQKQNYIKSHFQDIVCFFFPVLKKKTITYDWTLRSLKRLGSTVSFFLKLHYLYGCFI
jgi:hypothetical protein